MEATLGQLIASVADSKVGHRCDTAKLTQVWNEYGILDVDALDAVINDPIGWQELCACSVVAAPRIFMSLVLRERQTSRKQCSPWSLSDAPKESNTFFKAVPSLGKVLRIVPLWEMFFMKDHHMYFKSSWTHGWRDDGISLKDSICTMLDQELMMGSLFLGTTLACYFEMIHDSDKAALQNLEFMTLPFWLYTLTIISTTASLMQLGSCYVSRVMMQPIHENNTYAFLAMPSTQASLHIPQIFLTTSLFSFIGQTILFIYRDSSKSMVAIVILLTLFGVGFFYAFRTMAYCMNIAILGGFNGADPLLTQDEVNNMSGLEIETKLTAPVFQWRRDRGFDEPSAWHIYRSNITDTHTKSKSKTV